MTITFTIGQFIAVCAGILTVGGAGAFVYKIASPAFKILVRVDKLERRQTDIFQKLEEDRRANNILCKAMLALIDNRITDNGIDGLKIVKTDLVNFLADGV